jgi:hypothetical protein
LNAIFQQQKKILHGLSSFCLLLINGMLRHTRAAEMTQQGLQFNAWCRKLEDQKKIVWGELFAKWVDLEEEFLKLSESVRENILAEFDKRDTTRKATSSQVNCSEGEKLSI